VVAAVGVTLWCASFIATLMSLVSDCTRRSWTVRGLNSSGGEIFHTCPDWPWGQLSLLYDGYQFLLLGVQQPGYGIDSSYLALRLKEKLSYASAAQLGLQRPVLG